MSRHVNVAVREALAVRARVIADALNDDQQIKREISSREHCVSEPLVGEKTRVKFGRRTVQGAIETRERGWKRYVTSVDDCLKIRGIN